MKHSVETERRLSI